MLKLNNLVSEYYKTPLHHKTQWSLTSYDYLLIATLWPLMI